MLIIRFFRTGKQHQPSFKIIVVQKERAARSGKFIEELGYYDPLLKKSDFKKDRIEYWLSKGATVSDSAYNLLVKKSIIKGKKRPNHKLAKTKKTDEVKPAPVAAAAKPEKPAA